MHRHDKGKLLVISGPSGAGKSTVIGRLMELRDDVCFSVSVTTRPPRLGEEDGKDYFFVTPQRFQELAEGGFLLENAEYVGNRYGTPRGYVESRILEGKNVVLDIEVQGAAPGAEELPGRRDGVHIAAVGRGAGAQAAAQEHGFGREDTRAAAAGEA